MFLETVNVDWPKLCWLAIVKRGCTSVHVLHGSAVETTPEWCVEAVWAGHYPDGGFDKTDLVVGTGIRVRGDKVIFVTPGDTLNRLYYHCRNDSIYVSNSFTAIIAVADLNLVEDFDYANAMASIMRGLLSYERSVPSTSGPIHIIYYHNIQIERHEITLVDKPSSVSGFSNYRQYRDYLMESAWALRRNAGATGRTHLVTPLATISSGYDSTAAALLARESGATEAVTISQARRTAENPLDLNDCGRTIAEQLGLNCKSYSRLATSFPLEDAGWASMGNIGDINLTLFDYPQPLCLLFTGFMGDILWGKDTTQPELLHRKDTSGARFSEIRLELGVFVCSPVFWGCRHALQIVRLARQPEMHPWTLGTGYDRPIPRRLLEESGVSRESFGQKKRVSTFNRQYGRPLSLDLRSDFSAFLERRGRRPGSRLAEVAKLGLTGADWMAFRLLPPPARFSVRGWVSLPSPTDFFIWANERRRQRFLKGMEPPASPAGLSSALPPCGPA